MPHPFPPARLRALADRFGTPLWVYDAATMRQRIAQLSCFDTIRFAQKACSNIHVLGLMRAQGVRVDAVSRGEILRALAAGFRAGGDPADIVFTADLFDAATLDCVLEHGVPVNAGSIDMLHQLGARAPGHGVWLRINPGFGHGHSNKTNTGGEHSKHGIWHAELPAALAAVGQHGLKLVGLHMHIGSGVDYGHLAQVCGAMLERVRTVHAAGHGLHAISAGGGLSTPYRSADPVLDTQHYHSLWDATRRQAEAIVGHALGLEIEPGRYLVAEAGVLLCEVRATKNAGSQHFVLVDAGFNELMRPAMYGSYHAMSLLRRDAADAGALRPSVVAGPLCESGDVFTQGEGGVVLPRELPAARVGDLLVIHDTGAYGASMSSNYNTRPLIAEVLVDGAQVRPIRRRQTVDELLALERGL
ncbi:diaminopimelate decarboxylase [Verminephrobacter aporrectodeae subsp. tuberculatae]|uniref:Diaminopimelate decarboxylase n=2 Tax=Verminephrobacter TaxID=364316 RepID=A0ABT3KSN0_9BURK|nr:diaminopimelate decarboxylase [Verminephrobacter aporrectodeae]MCW5257490.1 diaminopimelate decarboxylase [Verminephrobacter aporrectodeae subsp. tuberculatae]MCW5321327.1 diaminopimelate decarboxylase [Verminephrobacter aporrectodeae subsp. tuberculatae]